MYESALIFWTRFRIKDFSTDLLSNYVHDGESQSSPLSHIGTEIRNDCGILNFRAQMNKLLKALALYWLQGLIRHLVVSTRPKESHLDSWKFETRYLAEKQISDYQEMWLCGP
jgi:hypothetical protein